MEKKKITKSDLLNAYKRLSVSGKIDAMNWNFSQFAVKNGRNVPISYDILLTIERKDSKRFLIEAKKRMRLMDDLYVELGGSYVAD